MRDERLGKHRFDLLATLRLLSENPPNGLYVSDLHGDAPCDGESLSRFADWNSSFNLLLGAGFNVSPRRIHMSRYRR